MSEKAAALIRKLAEKLGGASGSKEHNGKKKVKEVKKIAKAKRKSRKGKQRKAKKQKRARRR